MTLLTYLEIISYKLGAWCIGSMLLLGSRGTGFNSLRSDQLIMLKRVFGFNQLNKYTKIVLVLFSLSVILLGTFFAGIYLLTPSNLAFPKSDHFHLRLQYVHHNQEEDFSTEKYQVGFTKDICNGLLTSTPLHFHDDKNQIVHAHWQRISGGEFLKYHGLNYIGGLNDFMGWKISDLTQFPPKLTPIPIQGNNLPKPASNDKFFVYTGDKNSYSQKNWQDFLSQDLETFLGTNSKERLDQQKAKDFENKIKINFSGVKVEAHEEHSSTATNTPKTEEELKQINNLIGNIVIFVQPEAPSDAQIKDKFNSLVPLSLSACGG